MKTNIILQGDALTELKELPSKSINMLMASPPYWALRDYGTEGQLGLEPTFDEYINKLCDVFDEVKRVLRDDGTCWVNLGDTYSSQSSYSEEGRQGYSGKTSNMKDLMKKRFDEKPTGKQSTRCGRGRNAGVPEKSLCMIPMRFAIEMVNRGWILRNTIIWHKRNCMPSSVKDRFTVDFEYIFFFSKKKKYYFETQYEPHLTQEKRPAGVVRNRLYDYDSKFNNNPEAYNSPRARTKREGYNAEEHFYSPQGRNKRTVWTINPKPFKEAHFAVYPEELCETPIKAGCPEFVCVKCGKPRKNIYEKGNLVSSYEGQPIANKPRSNPANKMIKQDLPKDEYGALPKREQKEVGLTDCGCNADFTGGIVLDPFFGSGTTGLVALKQNKKFIGIELNKEYIEIAKKRLKPYLEQRKL